MNSLKLLTKKILQRADHYEWTLQGFGMLRLYLDTVGRLHVWDDRYAVPNVSVIHDHAWDFRSTVIAGELCNIVYNFSLAHDPDAPLYHYARIRTGEGGGIDGEISAGRLRHEEFAIYGDKRARGITYSQPAGMIHETRAERGTVTIIERDEGSGIKHARVFWPYERGAAGWVSAEPRPATTAEVRSICDHALERWFAS